MLGGSEHNKDILCLAMENGRQHPLQSDNKCRSILSSKEEKAPALAMASSLKANNVDINITYCRVIR